MVTSVYRSPAGFNEATISFELTTGGFLIYRCLAKRHQTGIAMRTTLEVFSNDLKTTCSSTWDHIPSEPELRESMRGMVNVDPEQILPELKFNPELLK